MDKITVKITAELGFLALTDDQAIDAAKEAVKEGYVVYKFEIVKPESQQREALKILELL